MKPTLEVDYVTKKVIVRTDASTHVYDNRTEAYEAWPELAEPVVVTPAQERELVRAQRQQRGAVNQYGHSKSGAR